jgi:hypothetical protein
VPPRDTEAAYADAGLAAAVVKIRPPCLISLLRIAEGTLGMLDAYAEGIIAGNSDGTGLIWTGDERIPTTKPGRHVVLRMHEIATALVKRTDAEAQKAAVGILDRARLEASRIVERSRQQARDFMESTRQYVDELKAWKAALMAAIEGPLSRLRCHTESLDAAEARGDYVSPAKDAAVAAAAPTAAVATEAFMDASSLPMPQRNVNLHKAWAAQASAGAGR